MAHIITILLILIVFIIYVKMSMDSIQKLTDKIMAKDFTEYKEQTEPVKYEPVEVTEEQEYWREIEERKV